MNSLLKQLNSKNKNNSELLINRHKVQLSHLNKVLWPKRGVTKKDLVFYYIKIADKILPELKNRPVTVYRAPEGVAKEGFWQRHFEEELPPFVKSTEIWTEDQKADKSYLAINNLETLLWLVNREIIEIHTWSSKIDKADYPDRIVFDLDPHITVETDCNPSLQQTALLLKSELDRREIKSWLKTTGLGGLHLVCPIRRQKNFDEIRAQAKEIAEKLTLENPKLITASYREEDKIDKVLIDWSQNARGKSHIAAWSPRADQNAHISTPISWQDLQFRKFESLSVKNKS